jgi:hypothetical protein
MTELHTTLQPVVSFVQGRLAPLAFETALVSHEGLEAALCIAAPIPPYSDLHFSLFHYLIGLHYDDPGDVLNAQDALTQFLAQHGIVVTPSPGPAQLHALLLSAQPRWLCADTAYLAGLLEGAPPLPPPALKAWLKERILERFRFSSRPPRWLQNPEWPVGPSGPLVFLGQIPLPNYFHDEAAVYVFHDPTLGACQTVIQVL